jgi:hypothetical protein
MVSSVNRIVAMWRLVVSGEAQVPVTQSEALTLEKPFFMCVSGK